jgi:hypothetical protein
LRVSGLAFGTRNWRLYGREDREALRAGPLVERTRSMVTYASLLSTTLGMCDKVLVDVVRSGAKVRVSGNPLSVVNGEDSVGTNTVASGGCMAVSPLVTTLVISKVSFAQNMLSSVKGGRWAKKYGRNGVQGSSMVDAAGAFPARLSTPDSAKATACSNPCWLLPHRLAQLSPSTPSLRLRPPSQGGVWERLVGYFSAGTATAGPADYSISRLRAVIQPTGRG